MNWRGKLRYDPIAPLLNSGDVIIEYFARRDILGEKVEPINYIWKQPEAQRIFKNQRDDGSWESKNKNQVKFPKVNYNLIETWKHFRFVVDQFEFNKSHDATKRAAEYLFSCQTAEGDIRGILAGQYAIYYTGAIMSLLIKAGYEDEHRIEKGFEWLLAMRQNDGGWVANTLQTLNLPGKRLMELTGRSKEPLKDHDKSKPFSQNGTGMVMRAFAIHKKYRHSQAAIRAAKLLKSSFFRADNYSSYRHPDNWVRFQYPFWWNNLVAALNSISLIEISNDDIDVKRALEWLLANQNKNGLWKESYSKIHRSSTSAKSRERRLWITLAICRILKRFWA